MYNQIIHTISFTRGSVPGVDNKKFKKIILKNLEPHVEDSTSLDYILTRHEDTKFPMNPEFEKILNHITGQFKYLHNKNLNLTNFWSHIHEKNMSTVTHNHVEKEEIMKELSIFQESIMSKFQKNQVILFFIIPSIAMSLINWL